MRNVTILSATSLTDINAYELRLDQFILQQTNNLRSAVCHLPSNDFPHNTFSKAVILIFIERSALSTAAMAFSLAFFTRAFALFALSLFSGRHVQSFSATPFRYRWYPLRGRFIHPRLRPQAHVRATPDTPDTLARHSIMLC